MKWSEIPQFLHGGGYAVDVEIGYLKRWLKDAEGDGLDLDPDFQRGHVWDDIQRIRFVEYLLRGGVSSRVIYWNCPSWMSRKQEHCDLGGDILIVDGKQRLTAVLKFLDNRIPAFGHLYKDFEENPQINQGRLKMQVNNLQTRKEVLTWYLQLNSGGVVHSQEELDRVKGLLKAENAKTPV